MIPAHVVPGRMALLVTMILVLVNIGSNVSSHQPITNGVTALSAWIISCIIFVAGALIAYAELLYKSMFYNATVATSTKICNIPQVKVIDVIEG